LPDYDMRVWEEPIAGEVYVIGGDPAEGLSHGDDSVFQVINCNSGDQACEVQGKLDGVTFGEVGYMLGNWYNEAMIAIENNKDLTSLNLLGPAQLGYPNLYYEAKEAGRAWRDQTSKLGWNTNLRTRPMMVTRGRDMLSDGSVKIFSSKLASQWETFALENSKYQAIAGAHDDLVMAYLIALEMMAIQLVRREVMTNGLNPFLDGKEQLDDYDTLWKDERSLVQRHIDLTRAKIASVTSAEGDGLV